MTNKPEKRLIIVHKIVQDVLLANLQTVDDQSADRCRLRIAVEDEELKESQGCFHGYPTLLPCKPEILQNEHVETLDYFV